MMHLIQALVSNPSPFEYVSTHLQLLGWPMMVYLAWKVSKYFDRAAHQITKTIGQIDTLSTNHFPHMEASLQTQDVLLQSMNESLKTIADNSQRRRENF
jgi:hypothetical protein